MGVRKVLTASAMTLPELRVLIQRRNPQSAIRDEDLRAVLQDASLAAVQVRDLWVLSRTGNDKQDAFRQVLVSLFRSRDSVSKQEILAEYTRVNGGQADFSDYVLRGLLRELTERVDGD